MTFYGILYQDGLIVDGSEAPITILTLFQKAAKNAYPEAQYRVGLAFMNGYGTQTDIGQG